MTRTIHVAHSTEQKIDTGDRRYEHELSDIESLNARALQGELDVSAVSIHAYAYLAERYALLASGCSMGDGYGPRLVSRLPVAALQGLRVGVPGKLTTAYLALKLFQADVIDVVLPFDQIEAAVHQGTVDVGLVIHEGQLTYADEGFELWGDLGAWWLEETGLPLPLGGNVVRRDLGADLVAQIADDLRRSIEYGLAHRQTALAYAKRFNRGITDERTDAFVGMYVNEWTVDYGPRGREAVRMLLRRGVESGIIPAPVEVDFAG
jgi:1,4-dihydroxy-6-naphthoate synthase